MSIAALILCHKNLKQVRKLVQVLEHHEIDCYVHLDRKCTEPATILRDLDDVCLITGKDAVSVEWADYSMIEATLLLIRNALTVGYDYYLLLSGQDWLVVDSYHLVDLIKTNRNVNYIDLYPSKATGNKDIYDKRNDIYFPSFLFGRNVARRILKKLYVYATGGKYRTWQIFRRKDRPYTAAYFGSQWWCFSHDTIAWMIAYLEEHPDYEAFFKNCLCPDESFFHTLFFMSPYSEKKTDGLHYMDWHGQKQSPKILTVDDYKAILRSGKPLARKFDVDLDGMILTLLPSTNKQHRAKA